MEFMTVKQAAEALLLSERTIHTYLEKGILTKYRGPSGADPVRLDAEEVKNFFRPEPKITNQTGEEDKV